MVDQSLGPVLFFLEAQGQALGCLGTRQWPVVFEL